MKNLNNKHPENKLILSIIVPTRNRTDYLSECLNFVSLEKRDDFEVIVQDNSDDPSKVRGIVEQKNDKRIKYFYDNRKLSQTENSDLALSNAKGECVCFIGDDDTICESIFDLAEAMIENDVDSCTYSIPQFNWLDLVEAVPSLSYLSFSKPSKVIKKVNSQKILSSYLRDGAYRINRLPRVYHGIVKKHTLDLIKNRCGSYFPGPSPDMANAVAVSVFSRKHYHVNIPMIISGYGKNSAGGMGKMNLHRGSLKNNFQLRSDVEKNWNPKIPKLWLQAAIYPESAYESLTRLGESRFIEKINYGAVYFECLRSDKEAKKEIEGIDVSFIDKINYFLHFVKRCFRKVFSKDENTFTFKEKIELTDAMKIVNSANKEIDVKNVLSRMK